MRTATDRARQVRSSITTLGLLAGMLVPTSALGASPRAGVAERGIGVRLIELAVSSSSDPLARSHISGTLPPGASMLRQVEVSNTTRRPATISIYAAAASMRRGAFTFGPNHVQNELSSWTSVDRDVLQLEPGATAIETVTVKVPTMAASGERYAVVWAAVTARSSMGGVTRVNRVGVRMYLSVGSGGVRAATFTLGVPRARRSAGGGRQVIATVRNSGRRTLEITGQVTLSRGPGGLRAGPILLALGQPLAPHSTRLVTVRLPMQLPQGSWHVRIRLTSGFLQRTSSATITLPAPAGTR
jgi:hypothetical protein